MRRKGKQKTKRPGFHGYEPGWTERTHTQYFWRSVDPPTVDVKDLGVKHRYSGPTAQRYFYAEETGVMYRRFRENGVLRWEAKYFTKLDTFDTRVAHTHRPEVKDGR